MLDVLLGLTFFLLFLQLVVSFELTGCPICAGNSKGTYKI